MLFIKHIILINCLWVRLMCLQYWKKYSSPGTQKINSEIDIHYLCLKTFEHSFRYPCKKSENKHLDAWSIGHVLGKCHTPTETETETIVMLIRHIQTHTLLLNSLLFFNISHGHCKVAAVFAHKIKLRY